LEVRVGPFISCNNWKEKGYAMKRKRLRMLSVEIKVTGPAEWRPVVEDWMVTQLPLQGVEPRIVWTDQSSDGQPEFELGQANPQGVADPKEFEDCLRNTLFVGFALAASLEGERLAWEMCSEGSRL
jgi:hypothetical protein